MSHDDVSRADYWSAIYRANDAGWDKGRCAPPIARLLREGLLAPGARLAVVGCGRGWEAIEAATLGFDVTAVDFAPEALEGLAVNAKAAGVSVRPLQLDVFELGRHSPERFDGVLEHTCLCAIDPRRRAEYLDVVRQALRPGGVYFGLLYAHGRPGGPPFDLQEPEARRLLAGLSVERLVRAADSFEARAGQELELVARRA